MSYLIDSDIQKYVASLVLGYLEKQQLHEAYLTFCGTSRYLTTEKKGLKYGNRPVDTTIGLINFISENIKFRAQINEFLRLCPRCPLTDRLTDKEDFLERNQIILDHLRYNIHLIENVHPEKSKKRKPIEQENGFDVSQSNASTPEVENAAKRSRKSLSNPFITVNSSNKENQSRSLEKSNLLKPPIVYSSSSSETSDKEDHIRTTVGSSASAKRTTPPILGDLSDVLLYEQIEKLAETINKTTANEENLKDKDVIVKKTTCDPDFEEILMDLVENYEYKLKDRNESSESTAPLSSTHESPEKDNEVREQQSALIPSTSAVSIPPQKDTLISPIKAPPISPIKEPAPSTSTEGIRLGMNLRPRKEVPSNKKVQKKKNKLEIISNELICPAIDSTIVSSIQLSNQRNAMDIHQQTQQIILNVPFILNENNELIAQQNTASMPITILSGSNEFTLISTTEMSEQTVSSQIIEQIEPQIAQKTVTTSDLKQKSVKKQLTPKYNRLPGFLEARSKSTPRRKATHIRILDFNQTPVIRQSTTERSPATPVSNGITKIVPGSAPPDCGSSKVVVTQSPILSTITESVIDENSNSNSNSVSATPRVGKDRRRRRITDAKFDETAKDSSDSILDISKIKTHADWFQYRNKTQDPEKLARNQYQLKEAQAAKNSRRKIPSRTKKTLSPKKKPVTKSKKTKKRKSNESLLSGSLEHDTTDEIEDDKPQIKVRITPKKSKPSPKTKKESAASKSRKKCSAQKKNQKSPTVDEMNGDKRIENELNRSDTVQEVATTLTQLHETILSKSDSAVKNPDMMILETPIKEQTEALKVSFEDEIPKDFVPNTPRDAVSLHPNTNINTPEPLIYNKATDQTPSVLLSIFKCKDIETPNFPITPGAKETPPKDVLDGISPSANSGYSRKTDYSSCSSYYKPDESEDIVQNFNKKSKGSERFSESDVERPLKIVTTTMASAKKVECSVTLERVRSFTEDQKTLESLHYNMMDDGVLSESIVTTTTASESSSSGSYGSDFTCSTCTTDSSDDEDNSMQKLLKIKGEEEKEKEWHCHSADREKLKTTAIMIDENTGEVRFPLRSWITPRKAEPQIESNEVPVELSESSVDLERLREAEESYLNHQRVQQEMELKRIRVRENLRNDSKQIARESRTAQPKIKKSNIKNFKPPAEMRKPQIKSKKDEILSTNLTERAIPTTLKLLPPLSSSSRRKSATPRKTITINELPLQPSRPSPVKERKKREKKTEVKSPSKSDRLSLETSTDNAVMPEGLGNANISSSLTSSFEDDAACTVLQASKKFDVLSQQSTLDKNEPSLVSTEKSSPEKKISVGFMSDISDDSDDSDDSCEDLDIRNAEQNKLNEKEFEFEPENLQPSSKTQQLNILPMLVKIEGQTLHLKDTGNMELFTFEPEQLQNCKNLPSKRCNEKKNSNFKNGKHAKKIQNPNDQEKSDAPAKTKVNDSVITTILESLHGK